MKDQKIKELSDRFMAGGMSRRSGGRIRGSMRTLPVFQESLHGRALRSGIEISGKNGGLILIGGERFFDERK